MRQKRPKSERIKNPLKRKQDKKILKDTETRLVAVGERCPRCSRRCPCFPCRTDRLQYFRYILQEPVNSAARVPALQAGGPGFKSLTGYKRKKDHDVKGLSNWGSPREPANAFFGILGVVIFFFAYSKLHYQSPLKHFLVAGCPAAAFYILVNLLFMRRKR